MTGLAEAVFTCGAKICVECGGRDCVPENMGVCGEKYRAHLLMDGNKDAYIFESAMDWHIELGLVGWDGQEENTIVRCPKHCKILAKPVARKRYPGKSYWEDAP